MKPHSVVLALYGCDGQVWDEKVEPQTVNGVPDSDGSVKVDENRNNTKTANNEIAAIGK